MVISMTVDAKINATDNDTLEEIALVHVVWAKLYPQWHSSEKEKLYILNICFFLNYILEKWLL